MKPNPPTALKLCRYGNRSGRSGVVAYACSPGQIAVQFRRSEDVYVYTAEELGEETIRHLCRLAEAGAGLSTFISQHVKGHYAAKLE